MNNIEKIKAEIERRKKICEGIFERESDTYYQGKAVAYGELLAFINSLSEEKPSEDLIKLIQKWDRIDINTVLKVKVKATGKVIDGFYDGRGHFDHFIDHDVFDRYFIDEVEFMPDEEPSDELEEAAEEYALLFNDGTKWKDGGKYKGFIAGAEWQKEQDVRDMYMSDNRNFLKCYEQGKKDMKEQMMKDAVEGEVVKDMHGFFRIKSECIDGARYKFGDWVKLIIVKED